MNAAVLSMCGLFPSWYLQSYARSSETAAGTFIASMLAVTRFVVRLFLWPVDMTWQALQSADTFLFELMSLGNKILFLAFVWRGGGGPHRLILQQFDEWQWTIGMGLMIGDHIYCLRKRDYDLRAMALMFDVVWYLWLTFAVLRNAFFMGEVFIWVFIPGGVIAVLSLLSSTRGTNGRT